MAGEIFFVFDFWVFLAFSGGFCFWVLLKLLILGLARVWLFAPTKFLKLIPCQTPESQKPILGWR
jgi:accessory gene regulator protein AgrB